MSRYRYFIKLAYRGTCYHGWQVQDNANSVQQELNNALSTFIGASIHCNGCGRTDTGVHAHHQIANIKLDTKLTATNIKNAIADPKNFTEDNFVTVKDEKSVLIPPNSFALANSLEYFKIPRDVTGLVTSKSSYARVGLGNPPTVLEAGWEGILVLELVNHTSNSIKVYSNSGISQILFFKGENPEVSYADRDGKYQGQVGITFSKSKY